MEDIVEKKGNTKNILDNLNTLLDPQNEWEIEELYDLLLSNENVKNKDLIPSIQQFRHYFEQLRKGFEYVGKTYGPEALPKEIRVLTGVMEVGGVKNKDFIGYSPENDMVFITLLHITSQCFYYGRPDCFASDSHLLPGTIVGIEDHAVLQAIEEGYHRYQQKALGMKPEFTNSDINHPLEAGIIPVWKKAREDLGIYTCKKVKFEE